MKCRNCGSKQILLLTSWVCDVCNPPKQLSESPRGSRVSEKEPRDRISPYDVPEVGDLVWSLQETSRWCFSSLYAIKLAGWDNGLRVFRIKSKEPHFQMEFLRPNTKDTWCFKGVTLEKP